MTRRFPAILLAASLLAATSAASAAPPVKKLDPDVVDVLAPVQPMQFPPKDLRLRMILEVDATTDVFEGGIGNTEDEIYYKMTGVRIIDRQVKTFNKTLRPSGRPSCRSPSCSGRRSASSSRRVSTSRSCPTPSNRTCSSSSSIRRPV